MKYRRMPIEVESPEQLGYDTIQCNLAESSVSDLKLSDLNLEIGELVLAYGHHQGKPELRSILAAKYEGITAEDVLITPGAASALFIIATSLLSKNDRLVVEFPNYATNLETPWAIGCDIAQVELKLEEGFRLDIDRLKREVNDSTKLISVTTPHNPTGTCLSEDDLHRLIIVAEENNCFLLVDETYRDLAFGQKIPLAATLSERVISVSSLSKASGLPGIRIGWLITKNKELLETFLAAKEQIVISNSVLDEEVAYHYLLNEAKYEISVKQNVAEKFGAVKAWMKNNPHMEWVEPSGGVVCFPRIKNSIAVVPDFHAKLLKEYSTLAGRGKWFGMDDRYMRIGFGWPSLNELNQGLANITKALQ